MCAFCPHVQTLHSSNVCGCLVTQGPEEGETEADVPDSEMLVGEEEERGVGIGSSQMDEEGDRVEQVGRGGVGLGRVELSWAGLGGVG